MRRTAEDAAKTRQAILDAARASFAEDGFAGTSLAAIAEAIGVTKGALYHHFTDKTALFRAVFVDFEHEVNDAIGRAAASAGSDPVDAFMAGCSAALAIGSRPDYYRIASVDGPAVLGAAEWHAIDADIGLASLRFGLQTLHEAGLLTWPFSESLVLLLFGALTEGTLAIARNEPDTPSHAELLAQFRELVFGSPAPPTP